MTDQIRNFLRIWSNLLEKSLLENFIFCAVKVLNFHCQLSFLFVQMLLINALMFFRYNEQIDKVLNSDRFTRVNKL